MLDERSDLADASAEDVNACATSGVTSPHAPWQCNQNQGKSREFPYYADNNAVPVDLEAGMRGHAQNKQRVAA